MADLQMSTSGVNSEKVCGDHSVQVNWSFYPLIVENYKNCQLMSFLKRQVDGYIGPVEQSPMTAASPTSA